MNWTEIEALGYQRDFLDYIEWHQANFDKLVLFRIDKKRACDINEELKNRTHRFIIDRYKHVYVKFFTDRSAKITKQVPKNQQPPPIIKKKKANPVSVAKKSWICVYCKERATTVDHIIPRIKGGTENKENLAHCCVDCNQLKGEMLLTDFVVLLSRLIVQSREMIDVPKTERYSLMLKNASELLDYEDKNYSVMFSASPMKKRQKPAYTHKRSMKNPLNMSQIDMSVKYPKPKDESDMPEVSIFEKAELEAKRKEAKKPIAKANKKAEPKPAKVKNEPALKKEKPIFATPTAKSEPELNYLEKQIAIARAAGYDRLWKYETDHPETWKHRIL